MLAGAWLLLGIGMGLGLYDAAFGTLGRIYGDNARRAITLDRRLCLHRRLAARFARDYRMAGNVLRLGRRANSDRSSAQHVFLPKTAPPAQRAAGPVVKSHIPMDHTMILLSFAFAAAWTVTSAMAAHLPRIVEAFGATPAQAVFGMMIGSAQVAARVLEASTLSRFHPLFSTRLA